MNEHVNDSAEDTPRTAPASEVCATPAALAEENAVLKETIAVLLARVAELERRLNSSNSGKPPTEAQARAAQSARGKPPGGQKGHKGETLRQVAEPDHTIDHYPDACPACGSALAMSTGYGARQVFDLPEPQPLRSTACRCGHCGERARFPDGVTAPVQYGPRRSTCCTTSFCPRAETMADLFGWWPRPSPG